MISGRAYRRCSVRVPALTAENCRHLALSEGWSLFDLTRTLVTLGATVTFLSLQGQEASDRFKMMAALGELATVSGTIVGESHGRRYAPRNTGPTALLPLYLPRDLSDKIGRYARGSHRTRNGVLARFLTTGFLIYEIATKALLETLLSVQDDLAKLRTNAKHESDKTET